MGPDNFKPLTGGIDSKIIRRLSFCDFAFVAMWITPLQTCYR